MVQNIATWHVIGRLLLAFGLTYLIGFERELRGSPAGNRTFSLVGVAGAVCGLFAVQHAGPTVFSGEITGVGFIGAAVTAHVAGRDGDLVRGLTTATTILASAAIGTSCGAGMLTVGGVCTALVLLTLELRWLPYLRWLDAHMWSARVRSETRTGVLTTGPVDGDPTNPPPPPAPMLAKPSP